MIIYSNYFMEVHRVLHCVRSSHRKCSVRKGRRPATLLKKILWHRCFPVMNFPLRALCLQSTSGRLLILLRDFIFQPFSMIDFISPTIKGHNMKCICSKCFREGITKSWIYYQFAARTAVKNVPLGLY